VQEAPGELHPNARRVQAVLQVAGCRSDVRQLLESTRTSAEAAAALGVEVGQIAKSLLFLADGKPVVVVASGTDRVDVASLASLLGAGHVERPKAEVVKEATGYPIGGVSPAGLPPTVEVLVDVGLSKYTEIWAAAGTPWAVYPTTFGELLQVSGARPVDVAEHR
jgi:prolyl-tRNA editing enzyme YbaK/EbsC (Cys-tRNA(Pro) deacylase)